MVLEGSDILRVCFPETETTPGVSHTYQVRMGRLDKAGAPGVG
jgi:hypothetical protein